MLLGIPDKGQLRAALERKYGPDVKLTSLIKRVEVISEPKWFRARLSEYIDEASKHQDDGVLVFPGESVPVDDVIEGRRGQRPGIDYVPSAAGVEYEGYLGQYIEAFTSGRAGVSPSEIATAATRFAEARKFRGRIAYHIVLKMDPRLAAMFGEYGVSVDSVFKSVIETALYRANRVYFPQSSLGWAIGYHHDTAQAHCHLLLLVALANGKGLPFSDRSRQEFGGKAIRCNIRSAIKATFNGELTRYLNATIARTLRDSDLIDHQLAESTVGIDIAFAEATKKLNGQGGTPSLSATAFEWQTLLDDPEYVDRLNAELPYAKKAFSDPDSPTKQRFHRREKGLEEVRERLSEHYARILKRGHAIERRLRDIDAHPDGYRPARYSDDLPGQSPNSTLSFIGVPPNPDKDAIGVTPGKVRRALTTRIGRLHESIEEAQRLVCKASMPLTKDELDRFGSERTQALLISTLLHQDLCTLSGRPHPVAKVVNFKNRLLRPGGSLRTALRRSLQQHHNDELSKNRRRTRQEVTLRASIESAARKLNAMSGYAADGPQFAIPEAAPAEPQITPFLDSDGVTSEQQLAITRREEFAAMEARIRERFRYTDETDYSPINEDLSLYGP